MRCLNPYNLLTGTINHANVADRLTNPVTINDVLFDGSESIRVEDKSKLPLAGGALGVDLWISSSNSEKHLGVYCTKR